MSNKTSGPRPKSATQTVCPAKKCGGVLWDVTSRLAAGMGVVTLQCDRCKQSWGVKVEGQVVPR